MASRIKIETHQLEIRLKGSYNYPKLNLWNLNGMGLTLNQLFIEYIEWLDTNKNYADDSSLRVFAFENEGFAIINPDHEFQSGRFEYGEYGVKNYIKNVRTRTVTHPKSREEAEVYPLYFLLYTPRNEKKALVILQRYGNVAMLTQFKKTFSEFLSKRYEYALTLEPAIPTEILLTMIDNGTVEELTLKRAKLPHDDSERIKAGGLIDDPESISVSIKGKGILGRDTLKKWLEDKQAVFIVPQLADVGLDGNHKTTVSIKVNGSIREIDFSDTSKIRPYIDIHTDDLVEKESGHPIFEEINRISKEYAKDILQPAHNKG